MVAKRLIAVLVLGAGAGLAGTLPSLSCQEMETFLRTARMGAQRDIPRGVTNPKRTTLDDGRLKHDAGIQVTHISKTSFTTQRGTELNFKDWWEFNVAGYEVAKMLDLNLVPPYVERKVGGTAASFTWWVEGILEVDRLRKNLQPPDVESWNRQMYVARIFNQLIANSDPNLTNFVIAPDWQLWMIDFTRAFRAGKDLLSPKDLVQCDRKLLAKMRELNKPQLRQRLKPSWVSDLEIEGLLARRDKIVTFFDQEVARKGESAVLFDLPRSGQPCGVGL